VARIRRIARHAGVSLVSNSIHLQSQVPARLTYLGTRKADANKNGTPAKHCSSRCKSKKTGALDRRIENAFVALLQGEEIDQADDSKLQELQHVEDAERTGRVKISARGSKKGKKKPKGDSRILVSCSAVENLVFGDRHDPNKTAGRNRDRAQRGVPDDGEWKSVDMVDQPMVEEEENVMDGDVLARMSIRSGTRVRPPQDVSEVNGGVGGEKGRAERVEENEEMLQKRIEGQQRAHEREMVRCAARRGVAFGLALGSESGEQEERRKCEAVMQGKVVESSFAKGDWSIRWREDV
jgi:hypothetical protein